MADLTARFAADFASFDTAVQGAAATLVDFEQGSNRVQSSLDRMTDQFSGRQVIQQADVMMRAIEDLGGTARMTQAELGRIGATMNEAVSKMDAQGMPVSEKMHALATETKGAGNEMSV